MGVPETPVYVEKKPRLDLENPVLSASNISTFRDCQKKWYFTYIDSLAGIPGYEAAVGNFIHDLYEDILQLDPDDRTLELAKTMAANRWDEFYGDLAEEFMDLGVPIPGEHDLKVSTWQKTRGLWEIEKPQEIDFEHAELALNTEIEGVFFKGFVDLIHKMNGDLVISDYKTGKMGHDRYLQKKIIQILLYGLALKYQTGQEAKRGRLLFVKDGIVEVAFEEDTMEETKKYLIRNDKAIRRLIAEGRDSAKAKTGPLCEWCAYIAECPEGQATFAKRRSEGRSRLDAPAFRLLDIQDQYGI